MRDLALLQNRNAVLQRNAADMARFALLMCAAPPAARRGVLPNGNEFGTALAVAVDCFLHDPERADGDAAKYAQLLLDTYDGKVGGPVPLRVPRSRDHLRVVRPEDEPLSGA